jgi:hypothetical protein
MAKKKRSTGENLIILSFILLFILPPVGILLLIIGIIWASAEAGKKKQPHIRDGKDDNTISTYEVYTENTPIPTQEDKDSAKSEEYGNSAEPENKVSEAYEYHTAHTGDDVRRKRENAFSGIITLNTKDIGEAIGLIRLCGKLAYIKNIHITGHVGEGVNIMNKVSRGGKIHITISSVKKAVTFIRKLYMEKTYGGLSLSIHLKHYKDEKNLPVLLEIAKDFYHATIGGEKDVLPV